MKQTQEMAKPEFNKNGKTRKFGIAKTRLSWGACLPYISRQIARVIAQPEEWNNCYSIRIFGAGKTPLTFPKSAYRIPAPTNAYNWWTLYFKKWAEKCGVFKHFIGTARSYRSTVHNIHESQDDDFMAFQHRTKSKPGTQKAPWKAWPIGSLMWKGFVAFHLCLFWSLFTDADSLGTKHRTLQEYVSMQSWKSKWKSYKEVRPFANKVTKSKPPAVPACLQWITLPKHRAGMATSIPEVVRIFIVWQMRFKTLQTSNTIAVIWNRFPFFAKKKLLINKVIIRCGCMRMPYFVFSSSMFACFCSVWLRQPRNWRSKRPGMTLRNSHPLLTAPPMGVVRISSNH